MAETLLSTGETIETITSLDRISEIAEANQEQWWKLVPPDSVDPFYLHAETIVRVVDWDSKEWSKSFLKGMYAEMGTTESGALYPFYRLTVVEERDGDVVYYNTFEQEVWRTAAPEDYNPYLFAFEQYGVESTEELSEQQMIYGRSSNVGTTLILLPVVFAESYAEDTATDTRALTLAVETEEVEVETTEIETLAMSTTSLPEIPGGGTNTTGGGVATNINLQVTMNFPLEEDFGPYLVLYGKQNLAYDDWDLMEEWIPTYGADSVDWLHAASSNMSCFYYEYFPATDTDMDGIADIVEQRSGVSTNGFCDTDTDGDGMLDAWEYKLFGDLTQDSDDDFDGEGLLNGEELVWYADNTVVMFSDPSLADTDGDLLDDKQEAGYGTSPKHADSDADGRSDGQEVLVLETDPLNPDTVAPVVVLN
ncbi:hypothetical protein [Pontiella sp.]|uniref:hypothetical protein n=1 Tax=Pontiella sp. TaxID=2837462 RepID=UPI0035625BCF